MIEFDGTLLLSHPKPIGVLIVGEGHGGREGDDFRTQDTLDNEVDKMGNYYLNHPDKSFHQQQVRVLLETLDSQGVSWVFSDLVKCFVWHGIDKKNNLNGMENERIAKKYCGKYLADQVTKLQPRKILGMGGKVSQYFGVYKAQHGEKRVVNVEGFKTIYFHSLFPTQRTADQWVAKNGWEPIIRQIAN